MEDKTLTVSPSAADSSQISRAIILRTIGSLVIGAHGQLSWQWFLVIDGFALEKSIFFGI